MQETNRQLTIAFFIAYVVGAVLITLHPVAPCLPLIGYAALGLFLTRDQRNSDRFADSLYYLGFLLTLTALLAALWHLSRDRKAIEIAGSLGAGLSASIVGLGLRVMVVQFRGTVSDQEEEARQSIEEQAAKVKKALEVVEQGWSQANGVLVSLRQDMEEFRGSINRIQADTLTTAQQRQTVLLASSAKAAEAWDQEIQSLRAKFARIDLPPALVRDAFSKVAEDLGKTAAQIVSRSAAVIEAVSAKFATVSERSEKCGTALEKLSLSVTTAVSASDEVLKAAEAISSRVRSAGDALGSALTNGADNLGKGAAALQQHVNTAGGSVAGFTQSLQGSTQALTAILPILENLHTRVNEAATAVAAVEGDINTSTADLVMEVRQVGADVKRVKDATGELVDLVTAELASS